MPGTGGLLVVGTSSGAGKSTVVSALCRAWARRGEDVAPFKAQNMSNHSAVTPDGGEIGRAQAMQALAAGVQTERRMNPVLLKPGDGRSHLVVLGEEVGSADAQSYGAVSRGLRAPALDALTGLRTDHAWVVAEGAGGAAEINLLDRDLVNLPLAAAAGLPAILVVDIDRGGAFASAHGTADLLPDRLRRHLRGIVINRFRGDAALLGPGIADLERRLGMPVLGVLPHLGEEEPMLAVEDSLDLRGTFRPVDVVDRPVRVAVVRLPRLANPSDLDPLVVEPSVELRWATRPGDLDGVDLVVVPGSRATVADLEWLRRRRLDTALTSTPADVVGICAGYQMLGRTVADEIESGVGEVPGLGLLPVSTTFARPKVVRRAAHGYEIRWGRSVLDTGARVWHTTEHGADGCLADGGRVRGTSLHGLFDDDDARRSFLGDVAARHGRDYRPARPGFAATLDAHLERLADWLEGHADVAGLRDLAADADDPREVPGW